MPQYYVTTGKILVCKETDVKVTYFRFGSQNATVSNYVTSGKKGYLSKKKYYL